jgi:hypothetical protein
VAGKVLRKADSSHSPTPEIFSVATQSPGKNRVQHLYSHGVSGMKTSLNEKVYLRFYKELGHGIFIVFKL